MLTITIDFLADSAKVLLLVQRAWSGGHWSSDLQPREWSPIPCEPQARQI